MKYYILYNVIDKKSKKQNKSESYIKLLNLKI